MKFKVAEHVFTVDAPTDILREAYRPFLTEGGDDVFRLTLKEGQLDKTAFVLELRQLNDEKIIEAGHIGGKPAFRFGFGERMTGIMVCEEDYHEASLTLYTTERGLRASTLDNALMVLYALSTADRGTLLMHASVVVKDGYGYLFVAPSGTGKSTHSSLWLKHIGNTHLLNDDNPVLRIDRQGNATVYGSPWSGKTPCYLNEHYPVGAVVQIAQAPCNSIVPLQALHAYSALTAAVSGKRWERKLADGLHDTLNRAVQGIKVYHLDCRPDEEAALLCYNTIKTHR